jgi:hypothetical membrane protein
MKAKRKISMLAAAYSLMLLVMFLLPFFSTSEYSITSNTLDELGAQNTANAWVMNITFIILGISSVISGWASFEGFTLHRILLVLFGISLSLIAFFRHAPLNPDIPYNITETGIHAYFACTALISFIVLSIATGFIMDRQHQRLLAVTAGLSAILLSVLTSESDHLAGVWQRLLFIISAGWMIYNFKTREY